MLLQIQSHGLATLPHFPTLFSSHKLRSLSPFLGSSLYLGYQKQLIYRHPTRKNFLLFASSSVNKIRASRKLMSDEELCIELGEFISAHELPEGHVPSFNDLSQRGRKDLAHIVRRRGYKRIRELLESSAGNMVNNEGEDPTTKADATNSCDEDEITGQDENVQGLVSLSAEIAVVDNYGSIGNTDPAISTDDQSVSTVSLLQEKVANFIQNGELESFEDDGYDNETQNVVEEGKGYSELENASDIESESQSEELSENMLGKDKVTMSNGRTPIVFESPTEDNLIRDRHLSTQGQIGNASDSDLDTETQERENEVQINHLKFMLHQKELELSQLKEQIEKEKLALSILQTKAETEIGKAQKIISEKDTELSAAEESLAGLKEVRIQYCVDAETVEVSGSFNGWHHRIKMDSDSSSSIIDPIESRKSRLWSATLWLYPGAYEIKFIVDGQWRIDPQRESVTRGTINNNILRVDR